MTSTNNNTNGLTDAQREEIREIIKEEGSDPSMTRRGILGLLGGGAVAGAMSGSASADLATQGDSLAVGGSLDVDDSYRIAGNWYAGPAAAQPNSPGTSDQVFWTVTDAQAGFVMRHEYWDGSSWNQTGLETDALSAQRGLFEESVTTERIATNTVPASVVMYRDDFRSGDYHAVAQTEDGPSWSGDSWTVVLQSAIDWVQGDESATINSTSDVSATDGPDGGRIHMRSAMYEPGPDHQTVLLRKHLTLTGEGMAGGKKSDLSTESAGGTVLITDGSMTETDGNGNTLFLHQPVNDADPYGYGGGQYEDVTLQGLTVTGDSSSTPPDVRLLELAERDVSVYNIELRDSAGSALVNKKRRAEYRRVRVRNCGARNQSVTFGGRGVKVLGFTYAGSDQNVGNCAVKFAGNMTATGVYVEGAFGSPSVIVSGNCQVHGGFIKENDERAIKAEGSRPTVTGFTIEGCPTGIETNNQARIRDITFNNVTTPYSYNSTTGVSVNGRGEESANAETPTASEWEPGDIVDFTDSGDGSGTGIYQLARDGSTWDQLA